MLNYKDLYLGFFNIMNNTDKFSENLLVMSQKWTDVFESFYRNQILPINGAVNPNLYPSLQNFKFGLVSAMKSQIVQNQFEVLVQTLHFGVCTGVTMTGLYTTTPPTSLLHLRSCFNSKLSIKTLANLLAINIFNWVQPTFSTQISSGVVIKWM